MSGRCSISNGGEGGLSGAYGNRDSDTLQACVTGLLLIPTKHTTALRPNLDGVANFAVAEKQTSKETSGRSCCTTNGSADRDGWVSAAAPRPTQGLPARGFMQLSERSPIKRR